MFSLTKRKRVFIQLDAKSRFSENIGGVFWKYVVTVQTLSLTCCVREMFHAKIKGPSCLAPEVGDGKIS